MGRFSIDGAAVQAPDRLLAVIVVHNSEAVISASTSALAAAARALRIARGVETTAVVVDNASRLRVTLPGVGLDLQTIRLEQNLGFAPAANLGAEQDPTASLILFLNPDTELREDALVELVCAFDDQRTALAGPLLVADDGLPLTSERPFHSLRREMRTQLFTRSTIPYGRRQFVNGRARCLTGACLLVERRFFDAVGGFDTAIRMYLEDVELCWRAHAAGREVRFVPAARCVHGLGKGSGGTNFETSTGLHLTLLGARVEFVRRRSGSTAALGMRGVIALGATLRSVLLTVRGRDSSRHLSVARWALSSGRAPDWTQRPTTVRTN